MPRGQSPPSAGHLLTIDAQTLVASLTALQPTIAAISVNGGDAINGALRIAMNVAADAAASETETNALRQQIDSLNAQLALIQAQRTPPMLPPGPTPPGTPPGSSTAIAKGMTPSESGALGAALGLALGSLGGYALGRKSKR